MWNLQRVFENLFGTTLGLFSLFDFSIFRFPFLPFLTSVFQFLFIFERFQLLWWFDWFEYWPMYNNFGPQAFHKFSIWFVSSKSGCEFLDVFHNYHSKYSVNFLPQLTNLYAIITESLMRTICLISNYFSFETLVWKFNSLGIRLGKTYNSLGEFVSFRRFSSKLIGPHS